MLGLFTLFVSPEDAVAGKTLEHYSSHYSTELGLKNSLRKDSQRLIKQPLHLRADARSPSHATHFESSWLGKPKVRLQIV